MAVVLSLLLQTPQEIDDLIRRLGSDVPEERDDAVARLRKIGPPAAPALEAATKSKDPDVRGHAAELLAEIARAERVKALRPTEFRITIDLRETPLNEAIRKTLHPFGCTEVGVEKGWKAPKVSLSLKDATLWEAVEALERAAGGPFDLSDGVFREPRKENRAATRAGPFRIVHGGWGGHSSGGGPSKSALWLKAWSSPGTWACSAEMEDVEMVNEKGTRLETEVHPDLDGKRYEGLPSEIGIGFIAVAQEPLKESKTLTVRGVLKIGFARDVECYRTPADHLPAVVSWGAGKVELRKMEYADGSWNISLGGTGGGEITSVLMSVEDARGRWLGDLQSWRLSANGSIGTSGSGWSLRPGTPARFVVLRAKGEDALRIPFTLSDVKPSP